MYTLQGSRGVPRVSLLLAQEQEALLELERCTTGVSLSHLGVSRTCTGVFL